MTEKDFLLILNRYNKGDATPEEKQLVERWYLSLGRHEKPIISDDGHHALEQALLSNINDHISKPEARHRFLFSQTLLYRLAVAASVGFILLAASYFYTTKVEVPFDLRISHDAHEEVHITNNQPEAKLIKLDDGSRVVLKQNSSLKFSTDFNGQKQREVYLKGEAFFEVAHNPAKPFLVHSNEVTTKVLGTSFTVYASEGDPSVKVEVKTGKVSVYHSKESSPSAQNDVVILTPNQKAVFDREKQVVSKTVVEEPQILVEESVVKRMRFTDAPVTEIFQALEQVYGITFEYDELSFASCRLTTTIFGDGMHSKLDVVCRSIGASYTERDGKFIIEGKGCN